MDELLECVWPFCKIGAWRVIITIIIKTCSDKWKATIVNMQLLYDLMHVIWWQGFHNLLWIPSLHCILKYCQRFLAIIRIVILLHSCFYILVNYIVFLWWRGNKRANMIYSYDLLEILSSMIEHSRQAKATVMFPKRYPYRANG